MERKAINKFKTILPQKGAFTIETDDDFPKMHTLCIASGKRGGGKSVSVANYIKRCKEKNYIDRAILITPTYNSNKQIWDIADIDENDVYEADMTAIKKAIKEIELEKKDWDTFLDKKKKWKNFLNDKNGALDKIISTKLLDYYSLGFLDSSEPPEWKYPVEQPPRIAIIIDDALGTDLMARRTAGLLNFAIKHRHIADGLGCSLFMLVQSYKAQGGINRAIRENTTLLMQFKVSDENQIQSIKEECDLPITDEEWIDLCSYAHSKPFNPLIIDFAPKCETKRFRSGWDEYVVPPSLKDKCSCKK
tara:strand:- start:295 stop:1209 length:915 start_codon:yes stop_codon:yes gene_type:complete